MAYTFVQVLEVRSAVASNANQSVTSTATNALFTCTAIYQGSATGQTITTTGGGTWTNDTTDFAIPATTGTDHLGAAIASCPSATGGTQTITVTRSAGTGIVGFVYEFSGNATSSIKDATSPASKTGTGTAADTNTLSNVTAAALFVAMLVNDDGSSPTTLTGGGTGWTYPAGGKETDGVNWLPVASGYHIVSSVTTNDHSPWTITSSKYGALIAVYKAAAAVTAIVARDIVVTQSVMGASTY